MLRLLLLNQSALVIVITQFAIASLPVLVVSDAPEAISSFRATTMVHFTELPQELVEAILLYLDPLDVARLSQCSKFFSNMVYNPDNHLLWRMMYLEHGFDNPEKCVTYLGEAINIEAFDFKAQLQRVMRARTIILKPDICRPEEREEVLETLLDLLTTTIPFKSSSDISYNLLWGNQYLKASSLIDHLEDRTLDPPLSAKESSLVAHLHTLFGLTDSDLIREERTRSRAFVYDMRKYSAWSAWGPFLQGGRVNWVHIRAVHHIALMHLVDMQEQVGEFPTLPLSLLYTQLLVPNIESREDPDHDEEDLKEEEEALRQAVNDDWAGVAGDWRISFCFCDHRELIKYNESSTDPDGDLDTSIFDNPDFGEVFRSLNATLHITGTIPDPQNPGKPVIRFSGVLSQGSSTMNGKVKMTPDGQVHWDFLSGEHGHAVWSSNGIHIGGLRSAYGVLGTWTTVFHDIEDPVGPFWMRKAGINEGILMDHVSH